MNKILCWRNWIDLKGRRDEREGTSNFRVARIESSFQRLESMNYGIERMKEEEVHFLSTFFCNFSKTEFELKLREFLHFESIPISLSPLLPRSLPHSKRPNATFEHLLWTGFKTWRNYPRTLLSFASSLQWNRVSCVLLCFLPFALFLFLLTLFNLNC